MSRNANPLSEGDIATSNVLPAFETSLRFGATEAELMTELGWQRELLLRPEGHVSGASTYRHMELMFEKPGYADFVVAAARAHHANSLGVVGLACKTMPNLGEAMACHVRFQRLTNRTATYETTLEPDGLHLRERRHDASFGSVLVSDYTLLVALHLLSLLSDEPIPVREARSRRADIPASEREVYERALGVALREAAACAELVFDPRVTQLPVIKADAEMRSYFRGVLESALPAPVSEPPLLTSVRVAIRERLRGGTPSLDDVAGDLRIGDRTLQRRLGELATSFQALLDDTRKGLAHGYLQQPQLTLAEIAYLLGYAEQASFFRAFRRWYDTTPEDHRRRRGTAGGAADSPACRR